MKKLPESPRKKQHEKELASLRNKMGKNIAWFDSLSKSKQYDILFGWKREKYYKRSISKPEFKNVKVWRGFLGGASNFVMKTYPASLKHFIESIKQNRKYRANVVYLRQASIDLLLNKK